MARDADRDGFAYVVERLTTGAVSVRDIVKEFCTSEEFQEKFIMNDTPNELARRLFLRFGKEHRPDPRQVKQLALQFLTLNWRAAMSAFIMSEAYKYGDDQVPLWQ